MGWSRSGGRTSVAGRARSGVGKLMEKRLGEGGGGVGLLDG